MYQLTKSGKIALNQKNISASTLQHELKIGYIRAANIVDALKQARALRKKAATNIRK